MESRQEEKNLSGGHNSWSNRNHFQWQQEQQHQDQLCYQQLHADHDSKDGTGFGEPQAWCQIPNIFHHGLRQEHQQLPGPFEEQQEEERLQHQEQVPDLEPRHLLLPECTPHLSGPGVPIGWKAVAAAAAASTRSSSPFGIPHEPTYQDRQYSDRDLRWHMVLPTTNNNDSNNTGTAAASASGVDTTTSRKRSIQTAQGNECCGGGASETTSAIIDKPSAKRLNRTERKRELEKQRRLDLNDRYTALIKVLSRIEKEEKYIERIRPINHPESGDAFGSSNQGSGIEKKGVAMSETKSQENAGNETETTARPECKRIFRGFINASNRADVIARTVAHLSRYGDIRKQQDTTIQTLKTKIKELERNRAESERKLREIERYGATSTMVGVLTNAEPVAVAGGGRNLRDKAKPDSEVAAGYNRPMPFRTAGGQRQQQQQQQQQMMTMMVPMMIGINHSPVTPISVTTTTTTTNTNAAATANNKNKHNGYNMQCIPVPMPSMGAQQFCNMMMMTSPLPAPILPVGQQEPKSFQTHSKPPTKLLRATNSSSSTGQERGATNAGSNGCETTCLDLPVWNPNPSNRGEVRQ